MEFFLPLIFCPASIIFLLSAIKGPTITENVIKMLKKVVEGKMGTIKIYNAHIAIARRIQSIVTNNWSTSKFLHKLVLSCFLQKMCSITN